MEPGSRKGGNRQMELSVRNSVLGQAGWRSCGRHLRAW